MPLLPRSRRGTWLLAGAVWLAVSAGLWWALPVVPRSTVRTSQDSTIEGFGPDFDLVLAQRQTQASKPDGTIAYSHTLELMDFQTGDSKVKLLPNPQQLPDIEYVMPVGSSRDGRTWLLVENGADKLRLLKLDMAARTLAALKIGRVKARDLGHCEFASDGRLAAVYDSDNFSVVLWNVVEDQLHSILPNLKQRYAFSANGRFLAALTADLPAAISVIDLQTSQATKVALGLTILSVDRICVSDDGARLAAVLGRGSDFSNEWIAKWWNAAAHLASEFVESELLAKDTFAVCWDVSTGSRIVQEDLGRQKLQIKFVFAEKLGFAGDDRILAIFPSNMRRFDLTTGKRLDDQVVQGAAWDLSPDGRTLLACIPPSGDGFLYRLGRFLGVDSDSLLEMKGFLYDAATGQEIGQVPGRARFSSGRDFAWAANMWSPDGKTLIALGSTGNIAVLWDIPPRKSLTWFTVGATLFALPIALVARRRVRRLRAA